MNKVWKWIMGIVAIIFLIAIIFPDNSQKTIGEVIAEQNDSFSNVEEKNFPPIEDQFSNIEQLHWTHMPLTYYINLSGFTTDPVLQKEVDKEKRARRERIERSILMLTSSVPPISFIETTNIEEADIIFGFTLPPIIMPESDEGYITVSPDTMTAGLAIPEIEENYILHSGIYITNYCEDYSTVLHELLHSFGLGHSKNDFGKLMSPKSALCKNENIDKNISICLSYIYSNGQIGECSSDINFLTLKLECESGWYPVKGTDYCCPESNMTINQEGYCE